MAASRSRLRRRRFTSSATCRSDTVSAAAAPTITTPLATVAAPSAPPPPKRWTFWRRLAWLVRTLRIPVLVFSVFGLGYQQGIIECTKHPQALQQQILRALLAEHGVVDLEDKVEVITEAELSFLKMTTMTSRKYQVASVGHRIVSAARAHVKDQLEQAIQKVLLALPTDLTPEQVEARINDNDDVQFWYHAALRLYGEANSSSLVLNALNLAADAMESSSTSDNKAPSKNRKGSVVRAANELPAPVQQRVRQAKKVVPVPWQYIVVDSPQPNAFVSEVLPQRFFITTAMMDVASTPNELAVILGHEVSHLILGHVTQTNQVETFLRAVEVLLLSLDPTSGLVSLFVVGGLATLRRAASAAHSRENERVADDLGLVITAKACYDTLAGSYVLYKMHQAKVEGGGGGSADSSSSSDRPWNLPRDHGRLDAPLQLLDTHPPTLERYERLKQQALDGENYTKYQKDLCATISSRLYAALAGSWGASSSSSGSRS